MEAELGLGRGHVTHMAGLDGGHGWDNARQGKWAVTVGLGRASRIRRAADQDLSLEEF